MQKSILLGVSVGESFAEYSLLSNSKPLAQKRVYLSRDNLKNSLQQFVNDNADSKPDHVFVSLRLPKKLLDYNLSGAVAHITTEGFEHWLEVCGQRDALTNADLMFSLHERILADGTIEVPLKMEDLEAITAKLQLVNCKKVCLHLLHAATYPEHLEKARQFLIEKGLEVFVPEKTDNPNEVTRWTLNALNATLSSVFSERKAELFAALDGIVENNNIHFLSADGDLFHNEKSHQVGSLFSASSAIGLHIGAPTRTDVLYLGLENFLLISGNSWSHTWQSPWGTTEVHHVQTQELGIQPTLGVSLNNFGHFDFSIQQESWEPGPMFLGRGQKATLLDFWAENSKLAKLQGLEDRIVPQGIQRFKNTLFALLKISEIRDSELGHLMKEMQSLSLQRLAMEAYLRRQSKKLIVTGPLAIVFANAFRKDLNTMVQTDEFCESQATALHGFKKLQESL